MLLRNLIYMLIKIELSSNHCFMIILGIKQLISFMNKIKIDNAVGAQRQHLVDNPFLNRLFRNIRQEQYAHHVLAVRILQQRNFELPIAATLLERTAHKINMLQLPLATLESLLQRRSLGSLHKLLALALINNKPADKINKIIIDIAHESYKVTMAVIVRIQKQILRRIAAGNQQLVLAYTAIIAVEHAVELLAQRPLLLHLCRNIAYRTEVAVQTIITLYGADIVAHPKIAAVGTHQTINKFAALILRLNIFLQLLRQPQPVLRMHAGQSIMLVQLTHLLRRHAAQGRKAVRNKLRYPASLRSKVHHGQAAALSIGARLPVVLVQHLLDAALFIMLHLHDFSYVLMHTINTRTLSAARILHTAAADAQQSLHWMAPQIFYLAADACEQPA